MYLTLKKVLICNEGGSLQTTNFEDENTSDFEVPQQAVLLESEESSFLENSVTQHAVLLESEISSDSENSVPQQAVLAERVKNLRKHWIQIMETQQILTKGNLCK